MRVLICGHCGGPLPTPQPGAQTVTCSFCTAVSQLDSGTTASTPAVAPSQTLRERLATELSAFENEFVARARAGESPAVALHAAASNQLAQVCDPVALTNVVFGIAASSELGQPVPLNQNVNAVVRLANAYLDALDHLRAHGTYQIDIPYLTSTDRGPVHFRLTLTIARLTELAAQPPAQPKKGWFKRVFG